MSPLLTPRGAGIWPLAGLFDALRREGFHVRPDDYIEVNLVLEAFKPTSSADLKALIAPLIVASDEEQEKFDKIFDNVFADIVPIKIPEIVTETKIISVDTKEPEGKKPIPPPQKPWARILATAFGLLLVVCTVLYYWTGPEFSPEVSVDPGTNKPVQVGDTLQFSVDTTLQTAPDDWARWRWEDADGRPYAKRGPQLPVIAQKAGPLAVALRSQRRRGFLFPRWTNAVRTREVFVCGRMPAVFLDSARQPGQLLNYRFTAGPDSALARMQLTQWELNGQLVATDTLAWGHNFSADKAAGDQEVRFVGYPDSTQRECYTAAKLTVRGVAEKEPPFRLDVRQTGGTAVALQQQMSSDSRWTIGLLGVCIAGFLAFYYWLEKRRQAPHSPSVPAENPLAKFQSEAPPLEIPLEDRTSELITRDQLFHHTVRLMRQPTEAENNRLHIRRTMQATMQGGGFPTLVYEPYQTETEYLFLIDRTQVRSQQVALFEYLFKAFAQESVCVERYFFQKTFKRFTNETNAKGLGINQLAERYRTATLVVWGNGSPLLYPAYPVVEPFVREALAHWKARALLTPVPFADWGPKERALQASLPVFPADIPGQLRLLQALADKTIRPASGLPQEEGLYSVDDVYFEDVGELRAYLGEALFQWLAATAVYPRIRWEVVVEMGRALLPASTVNFTNLLRLARISWMHEGSFPDHTRLELLKHLRPDQEAQARRTLLRMLTYAEHYFPGEHFYDGEKYVLQTVNQFLLYAHQPETYAEFAPAQQAFQTLHEQGLYADGTSIRYLENPNVSWPNLLPMPPTPAPGAASETTKGEKTRGGSLIDYLERLSKAKDGVQAEKDNSFRRLLLIGVLAPLVLLLALATYAGLRPASKILQPTQFPVTLTLDSTACATAQNTTDGIRGANTPKRWTVFLGNQELSFKQLSATVRIPVATIDTLGYRAAPTFSALPAVLTVRDSTGQEQRQLLTFQQNRAILRIGCAAVPPISRPTVYIQYAQDDAASANSLRTQLNAAGYNAPATERIQAFRDTTQVRYFVPSDEAQARAVARVVKELFKLRAVRVVQVQSPEPSPVEVWLNTRRRARKGASPKSGSTPAVARPRPGVRPAASNPTTPAVTGPNSAPVPRPSIPSDSPRAGATPRPELAYDHDPVIQINNAHEIGGGLTLKPIVYDASSQRVGQSLTDGLRVISIFSLGLGESRQFTLRNGSIIIIKLLQWANGKEANDSGTAYYTIRIENSGNSIPTNERTAYSRYNPNNPYKRILWVDDNPENNDVLIKQFICARIDVVPALNNATARAYLDQYFDLIISDIGRAKEGEKAGLELLREAKKTKGAPRFILYTSPERANSDLREAVASGAAYIISDPIALGSQVFKMLDIAPRELNIKPLLKE